MKDRQIHAGIDSPHPRPVGLSQQFRFGELSRSPLIEHGLRTARQHLHADHHVRALYVKGGDDLQLPAMMIRIVVMLSEQNHTLVCEIREQLRDCQRAGALPLRRVPLAGAETGLRRWGARDARSQRNARNDRKNGEGNLQHAVGIVGKVAREPRL